MTTKPLQRLFFLMLGIALSLSAAAQNFSKHNWYFGNSAQGIRFSRSDNTASLVNNQGIPFGIGGSAVASYPITGNVFFYTDGFRVYDASHQIMPQGNALTGDNTLNQPVVICKNPANSGEHIIFHNSAGAIRFTVVDSVLNGNAVTFGQPPLGDVDPARKNIAIPLLTGMSEAMLMLPNSNGRDFWLITHRSGTTDYYITAITSTAIIGTTTIVTTGLIQQAASFSYHEATSRIAVAPQEPTRDVEVFTFTDTPTPSLTAGFRVLNSAVNSTTTQAIYDTEFSKDGQYLYVSVHGEPGIQANVLQYDLLSPSLTAVSVLPTPNSLIRSYGLQMAPDSAIYHLYELTASPGVFRLGRLTRTDSVAGNTIYTPQAFAGNFNGKQFPSFAPADSIEMKVWFTTEGLCANAPTSFFPTVTPAADSLNWDFGDGTGSREWSPIYTYTAGGTYPVTVTAFLNGQQKDSTINVTINNFDTQISLVQDTTACSCELPFPKTINPPPPPASNPCNRFTVTAQISGSGNPSWQWYGPAGPIGPPSTGTTATLQPDSAGYYYLVASVGTCETHAGVNIKEYNLQDQTGNFWYFGLNAGIDFNPVFDNPPGAPLATSNPVMDAPEGTATISDQNGQVVFYTDGNSVWNRNHVLLTTGIGGELGSTQSSVIIPVQGDQTLYYIFTTQEIHGSYTYRLSYSLFDLKKNGGTGDVVEQNITLFTKSTERITANPNWLIAHEYGNNTFRAYRVSANGIGSPVLSAIGSDHTTAITANGQGYMKLGPQDRLAVALSSSPTSNKIEVFDFDPVNGDITNFRSVNLTGATGEVYGVELTNTKIFATLKGTTTSRLYEFAFDTLGIPFEIKPPQSANVINEELGAIQTGPDGQIYVAVKDKPYLGTIQVNSDTTVLSIFTANAFALNPAVPPAPGTALSRLGLPNNIQNNVGQAGGPFIAANGFCLGDTTFFTGSGTDPIDTLFWDFGDGNTIKGVGEAIRNQAHRYAAIGTYNVQLRISNRCVGLVTILSRSVTITAPPVLPPPVSLCQPPQVLDANPSNQPNLSYAWDRGDTTRVITITHPGAYPITLTNTLSGCATSGVIDVFPSLTTIDFGPDSTVCSATGASQLLNTNINIPNHTWRLSTNNGAFVTIGGNNGPTQLADFSTAGVFTYAVEFLNTVSGCYSRDTITFTVRQSPVAVLTGNGPIACGTTTGQLTLNITQPTTSFVSFILAGAAIIDNQQDIAPVYNNVYNNLPTGTYIVQVTDQVDTRCFDSQTVTISSSTLTVTPTPKTICQPETIAVNTNAPAGSTFRVLDVNTTQVVDAGGPITTFPNFTTLIPLPAGDYLVEVTIPGALPCVTGTPVTLTPGAPTPAAITDNLCFSRQLTITGAPGTATYDWSASDPGSIDGSETGPTVTINEGGPWTINVTVTPNDATCPVTLTQVATVDTSDPDFTPDDQCQNLVTLTAQPTGTYFYNWYDPGNTLIGTGQQVGVTATGNYRLERQNFVTGCPATQIIKNISVLGPLTVTLMPITPVCQGSEFQLEAQPSRAVQTFAWTYEGSALATPATPAILTDSRAGNYTITVTSDGGLCTATEDIDLDLAPVDRGALSDLALICPDPAAPPELQVAELDAGDSFISYDWYLDGGSLNDFDQFYTASIAGEYTVNLINSFNCASTDKTTVEEECDPIVTGPNAFRPGSTYMEGGEMVNQRFRLFTFFIDDENFQVYIFNRWGEMVYQTTDRDFRWNGGYNNSLNQLLPAGTYTYVVRYQSSYRPELGVQEKRGGVLLVR